jgi:hypothetical protein
VDVGAARAGSVRDDPRLLDRLGTAPGRAIRVDAADPEVVERDLDSCPPNAFCPSDIAWRPTTTEPAAGEDASLRQLPPCKKYVVSTPLTRAIRSEPLVSGSCTAPLLDATHELYWSPHCELLSRITTARA